MSMENLGNPERVGADDIAVVVIPHGDNSFVFNRLSSNSVSGFINEDESIWNCDSFLFVWLLQLSSISELVDKTGGVGENNISALGGSTEAAGSHSLSAVKILLSICV